jgi:hypothetical protein
MPQTDPSRAFPGAFGKDYHFVTYGGQTYVVYSVVLPGGKKFEISWKLSDDDVKRLGIKPDRIKRIGKDAFQNLNNLGAWADVAANTLPDEHPFQTFLKELRRQHGNVSWLDDPEFVSVLLEGWAEGWGEAEIQNVLEQTSWYQTRNEAQRAWEMDLNRADRRTSTKNMVTTIQDALRELYGAEFNLSDAGITQQKIKKWAEQIASGRWGDPSQGFQQWLSTQTRAAEQVEGTPAWISLQQQLQDEREFANGPEEMYEALRQEASYWLGPNGVMSEETLRQWSSDLFSGVSSQADWSQFLQQQAQTLYPYLGDNTPWQQFADPYKAMIERLWGAPVDWDHPLLQQLGGTGPDGAATGTPVSFYDFELLVRQDPQFWSGQVARTEGFELLSLLNQTFRGVT